MKKMALMSVAAMALLFVGCGDKPKAEANVTETVTTEVNATETVTTETITTEVNATEAAPEAAAPEAAAPAVDGAALYTACGACHGVDGKTAALGKSAVIAGQSAADLATKMKGYKAGTIDLTGNGALMKGQMATLDDAQMEALADYISKL
ncbi:MAG: c-type cytochrome [Sulfurovaceae bacterium]|nr:c-type cytochrome [Sulfurovaceae bacterium]